MLYVYGIVDAPAFPVLAGAGLEGADIAPADCDGLSAAVSTVGIAHPSPTPQNVWRHERAIERLMARQTVLPLRFGTVCEGVPALQSRLAAVRTRLSADFDRLRGKCEIALHVTVDRPLTDEVSDGRPDAPRGAGRGAAYLRGRLRDHREHEARARACRRLEPLLREALRATVADLRFQLPNSTTETLCAACLIDRNRMSDLEGALVCLRLVHSDLRFVTTGPWAPYSFVSAAEDAAS